MGIMQLGENNVSNNMYVNYSNISPIDFPSGDVKTFEFINTKIIAHLKPNLDINIRHQYFRSKPSLNNLYFSLNYHLPIKFSL